MLAGQRIVLGVTGSIAAYKAAVLLRLLIKNGAEVRVLMTPAAKQFVAPLTFATLARNPVPVEFFNPENGTWNSHVATAEWATMMLIAPATANSIAKMACGIADNLLLCTYLSVRCPVVAAPAMDSAMFLHTATQRNLTLLKESGVRIIEPASGELASGLQGKGRMAEPEIIVEEVLKFVKKKSLTGKTALVTAGPTHEYVDPVRFIGNASSGQMGYAIAESLAERGAKVHLVSGPVKIATTHSGIVLHKVCSAKEMYDVCMKIFPDVDIAVMTAAVADFTPKETSTHKIKRGKDEWQVVLTPTQDIAHALGSIKRDNQLLVGFALEDCNELENAQQKLRTKNLDMIVLNSLNDAGAGFDVCTNKITLIDKNGSITNFPLKHKREVAEDVVEMFCN